MTDVERDPERGDDVRVASTVEVADDGLRVASAVEVAEAAEAPFDPIDYLNNEGWQAMELGLERIHELMRRLGDPLRDCAFVHVAGTNGKGSVCAYIERVLREADLNVGLFTSPAIYSFEERIVVNGEPIGPDDLFAATQTVKRAVDGMVAEGWEHPTGFELMFAVAAEHFRAKGVRIAVLEVGLGGRLDATNVIAQPEVCVITPIGLDHTAVLGSTIEAIAAEKAAIIKPGSTVVTGFQDDEALRVIEAAAARAQAPLTIADATALTERQLALECGVRRFTYRGGRYETALIGSYQPENAALAIEACRVLATRGWPIDESLIRRGIAEAVWPGRFEIVSTDPLVIVDGAHNPPGAASLRASLEDLRTSGAVEGRPIAFVLGVLADKDARGILKELLPLASAVATFPPPSYRALPAEDLAALARKMAGQGRSESGAAESAAAESAAGLAQQKKSPEAVKASGPTIVATSGAAGALERARRQVGDEGLIVCAGSLYSLGEIREALLQLNG